MRADWLSSVEPMVYKSRIKVPYTWSVGETGSRFFVELRDNKRLLGRRCAECRTVYVPPRKMCGRCFRDTDHWVEVGPEGTLQTFTVVRYSHELQPMAAPFAYGIILLDRASTGLVHVIGEADLDSLRPGIRLAPVFRDQRSGTILDIAYFRPVGTR